MALYRPTINIDTGIKCITLYSQNIYLSHIEHFNINQQLRLNYINWVLFHIMRRQKLCEPFSCHIMGRQKVHNRSISKCLNVLHYHTKHWDNITMIKICMDGMFNGMHWVFLKAFKCFQYSKYTYFDKIITCLYKQQTI